MRNLELVDGVSINELVIKDDIQCVTIDNDNNKVYYTTKDTIYGLEPHTQQVVCSIPLCDELADICIISAQYLPHHQSLCIATQNGHVILYNTVIGQVECVGSVESGLTGMAWSPDQEIVILTTGQDTLIMMTKDFEPITENQLNSDDFGERKPVTVGWGKKETQFHGSLGKEAAKKKEEKAHIKSEWDDGKIYVSWRGDGQYFVVSSINPESGCRWLRIWSRDCVLQSTSEDVNGLEQAVSWKPTGSLIASSQRLHHRQHIVFFEKNGLRHGEFPLPLDKIVTVKDIIWNTDSTVLAVSLQVISDQEENVSQSYVQLWTCSNYHWYLKQNLHFKSSIAAIQWDPEHAYTLHTIMNGGQYLQYTWSWATHHSNWKSPEDNAYVAVIDGASLLMTPFRYMMVPPPMCAYSLQLPAPVNNVTFGPPECCNSVAVLLSDERLVIYDLIAQDNSSVRLDGAGGNGFKTMVSTHKIQGIYRIMKNGQPLEWRKPLYLRHLAWISMETMLVVAIETGQKESVILELGIDKLTKENAVYVRSKTIVDGQVFQIHGNQANNVAIQLTDGSLLKYDSLNSSVSPWTTDKGLEVKFPQRCVSMGIAKFNGQETLIGLTERFRLYANDTELSSTCTSFSVHDEYLLLTTHNHTLQCISLLSSPEQGKSEELNTHQLERGSRIVIAVPSDTKIILQMPRGNLEVINPRSLILSAVKKHLDMLEYKEAVCIMRKHRLDMNLIYDHSPQVFLDNVDKFVSQLDSINHINLFLADLKKEDVTTTMYISYYSDRIPHPSLIRNDKVDKVCDAVRIALENIGHSKYFLSIITTYIKKTVPELDIALQKIKNLQEKSVDNNGIGVDAAFRYVLYMVDIHQLYNVALASYDFDLVLMVAEKSQMDPKEYLPYLNKLRVLESNYQKYTIDKHLKHYGKALQHISLCDGHFDECIQLIQDHSLYVEALKLYQFGTTPYKIIGKLYGEYLENERHYEEAALLYTRCDDETKALEMYQKVGNWRQALCLATKLQYSKEKKSDLCRELADYLHAHRQYSEAAYLLEHYIDDMEEAIVMLIDGSLWDDALLTMYRHNRMDIIETNLKPALLLNFNTYVSQLDGMMSQFETHKNRLAVVRETKEKRKQGLFDEDGVPDKDGDLFSDTSSIGRSSSYTASSSRISGRSSKNRRKAERKKYSLKEGSEFEEFALLQALCDIVMKVEKLKGDVGNLLKALIQCQYDIQAGELQLCMEKMVTSVDKSMNEIWKPDLDLDSSPVPSVLGPQSTANSIATAMMQANRGQPTNVQELSLKLPPKINKDTKWKLQQLQTKP